MNRLFVSCAAAMGLAAACVPSVDKDAAEQTIRDIDARWVQAVAAGDADAIAEIYAEDAYMLLPNQLRVSGREGIRGVWEEMLSANMALTFTPNLIEIAVAGDLAYEVGTYNLAMDGPDGRTQDNGSYLVVWRNVEGEWKVAADISNTDQPLEE